MNLVFLGAPGSGKGTQAARLARDLSVLHLSTGDLLRAALRDGTELGRKADRYMKAGNLVPDDVIIGLIEEKRRAGELDAGFILDGFPRTMSQAEALDTIFEPTGDGIDRAVFLEVDDEEIIKRLSGRVFCPVCQTGYNYPVSMPRREGVCDSCGGRLARRPDDEPEVVKNRLAVYRKETKPIEGYYRTKSVLLEIEGVGTPDDIFARIKKGLGVA
jgi:adenylate kinase